MLRSFLFGGLKQRHLESPGVASARIFGRTPPGSNPKSIGTGYQFAKKPNKVHQILGWIELPRVGGYGPVLHPRSTTERELAREEKTGRLKMKGKTRVQKGQGKKAMIKQKAEEKARAAAAKAESKKK